MCAAPTPPTLATITAEGLKKAGYTTGSSQYSTLLTRAQNEWMEEIKFDVWMLAKKLRPLQTMGVVVVSKGKSRYSLPTDFSSYLSVSLVDGNVKSTFQAGSTTTSWVLNASEASAEEWIIGKEIVVYAGTAARMIGQVTAYSTSTKTATVVLTTGETAVAPVSGDSYMIVDYEIPLTEGPVWDYDKYSMVPRTDRPTMYFPLGDSDDGELLLREVPDDTYALKIRYYADLLELDLAGTLMGTLYKRWRNIFIQGVYAKALQEMDDARAPGEFSTYGQMIQVLASREVYGYDLSGLQSRVEN